MFHRLQAFQIDCDAPAYPIVQACRTIGLRDPEDVRWVRLARFCKDRSARVDLLNPRTWTSLLGGNPNRELRCSCGQELPNLDKCTFTLISGKELHYYLGQCGRCHTVFWEEA